MQVLGVLGLVQLVSVQECLIPNDGHFDQQYGTSTGAYVYLSLTYVALYCSFGVVEVVAVPSRVLPCVSAYTITIGVGCDIAGYYLIICITCVGVLKRLKL